MNTIEMPAMEFGNQEKEAIEMLRVALGDTELPYKEDIWIIKWLRARNFDVAKAEDMLRNHLKWRKDWDIDKLVRTYKKNEILVKYETLSPMGYDKDDCPVLVHRVGNTDYKGILSSIGLRELLKHNYTFSYNLLNSSLEKSKNLGKDVSYTYVLYDLDGFKLGNFISKIIIEGILIPLVNFQNQHFPEIAKKIVCINCPATFYNIFQLLKPLLSQETTNKIAIFGRDGWKDYLLNDIDPSQLPEAYGGTLTDGSGDPRCPKLVKLGGLVPEEFYLSNRLKKMVCDGVVKRLNVSRRSVDDTEALRIYEAGSILKCTVYIENHDIDVKIVYDDLEGNQSIVHREKLLNYDLFVEADIVCSKPGKYFLRFDNSGSFFRGKEVFYKLEAKSEIIKNKSLIDGQF